jgi:alkyl hydroperoxide reductase subunit D
MPSLEELRGNLPEVARDTKLNVQAVLQESTLSVGQRWGVAIACAAASRNRDVLQSILAEAVPHITPETRDDALAAASLMAMNNVYYRFRHLVGKDAYSQKPARLRMNRLAKTAGPKVDFELFCLAVSAINACEACIQSHEKTVLAGGLSEDHVHDAVRIASVIQAFAVSLELPS